jgi:hypothetical protein
MTRSTNDILDDLAQELAREWLENGLSTKDVQGICANLFLEAEHYHDVFSEAAWEAHYDPERLAASEESYRADIIAAGRGHLLRG